MIFANQIITDTFMLLNSAVYICSFVKDYKIKFDEFSSILNASDIINFW